MENSIHLRIRKVEVESWDSVAGFWLGCRKLEGELSFRVRSGLGRVRGGQMGVVSVVMALGQGLVSMSWEKSEAACWARSR